MSLKGYYKLESDGTDYSGNGYTATGSGTPTYVSGKFGKCTSLARASSQFLIVNSTLGITSGAITMSAWVNFTGAPADNTYYGICGHAWNTANYVFYRVLYAKISGVTQMIAWRSFAANNGPAVAATLTAGTWYHVVETYDNTNVNLYLNGRLLGSVADSGQGTGGPIGGISSEFVIGQTDIVAYGNKYWNGLIDEVIVHNTAWSAQDVRRYYNQAKGRFAPSIS